MNLEPVIARSIRMHGSGMCGMPGWHDRGAALQPMCMRLSSGQIRGKCEVLGSRWQLQLAHTIIPMEFAANVSPSVSNNLRTLRATPRDRPLPKMSVQEYEGVRLRAQPPPARFSMGVT